MRHEARDHAVKDNSVIEAAAGEIGDPLDVIGRKVGPKLDDDVAAGGEGEGQAVAVGHGMNSG